MILYLWIDINGVPTGYRKPSLLKKYLIISIIESDIFSRIENLTSKLLVEHFYIVK